MTAFNIDIEQFMTVLTEIHRNGIRLINLDMLPDDDHPSRNKLIIHPVKEGQKSMNKENIDRTIISNPKINLDGDDIFNVLNNF